MRYLVTGGAGFIGSNTVEELVRRGHGVVVLDDLSGGKEDNLAEVRNKITFIKGSVTDLEIVRRAIQEADYVLHLAARTSVPRSVKDPVETMPPEPISPYGVSKYAGELYVQVFGRCYGLENVSLRYFNVFGPRQDPGSPYSGVLSRFITCCLDDAEPVIYGDGEQSRDFTYVENVVQANLLACEAPNATGKVLNVGTGGRFTLNQTLKLLEGIAGKAIVAKFDPPRDGDIRDSQADITQSKEILGYNPIVGFEEGLRRTYEWYRSVRTQKQEATEDEAKKTG